MGNIGTAWLIRFSYFFISYYLAGYGHLQSQQRSMEAWVETGNVSEAAGNKKRWNGKS